MYQFEGIQDIFIRVGVQPNKPTFFYHAFEKCLKRGIIVHVKVFSKKSAVFQFMRLTWTFIDSFNENEDYVQC